MKVSAFILSVVSAIVYSVSAHAAAISVHTPWPGGGVSGRGFVVGYAFTASQDIDVTALGHYDAGRNGFANPAQVGLYTAGGATLATADVESDDALDGYFRFESIVPVRLLAGVTYVMGAYLDDPQAFFNANYGGISYSVDPLITLIRNRDLPLVTSLQFPSREPANRHAGSFGPNFQFSVVAQVPEPTSLALLGAAVIGLGSLRRRKA